MAAIKSTMMVKYKTNIYRKIVFSIIETFSKGSLSLRLPDGEKVFFGNGEGVSCEINIKSEAFFRHIVLNGDIGFGEAYVDELWDTNSISKVIQWMILNIDDAPLSGGKKAGVGFKALGSLFKLKHKFNENSLTGAKKNISYHYDLSNELYEKFLDDTMTYSCAYFKHNDMDLSQAQLAKYEMLANSLDIKSSDHVLEVGCGWGSFSIYIAKKYGCKVTGITISHEQLEYARKRVEEERLSHLISFKFIDYREMQGQYDKIASIEMIEAVGAKYFKSYFKKLNELLKPNGVISIQAITSPDSRFHEFKNGVDWIQTYIFPGSLLPSIGEINRIINKHTNLHLIGLKDFGIHYAKTLNTWNKRFNENWSEIANIGFDKSFKRKWNYYLQYCEAAFYMRNISVVQLTLTRPNNTKLYREFSF